MKHLLVFSSLFGFMLIAVIIGLLRHSSVQRDPSAHTPVQNEQIPHIGNVQVLNGCGEPEIARAYAALLRKKNFDVKNEGIDNAETFNYPFTLVASRQKDMSIARAIATSLHIDKDKVILMRIPASAYDATLIIGKDFERYLPE